MRFVDFFAGIGGIRLGLEKAGHKCVGFCEWDKYARTAYKAMYNTEGEWEEWMNKAFAECFRVLKPGGMLLFKWNDEDIPHRTVLRCALPYKPIAGDRKGKTRWTFFCKYLGGK